MAQAIVEVLDRHGGIDRAELAGLFAGRYQADPYRGYGLSVRRVLDRIAEGIPWEVASREVFGGTGSMGNGGAMRVAPLGAYFADDLDDVVEHAGASAEVTHAHPEGRAGAIATAVAAAWAWHARTRPRPRPGREMIAVVLDRTPEGETRAGLKKSLSLGPDCSVVEAVGVLATGAGSLRRIPCPSHSGVPPGISTTTPRPSGRPSRRAATTTRTVRSWAGSLCWRIATRRSPRSGWRPESRWHRCEDPPTDDILSR